MKDPNNRRRVYGLLAVFVSFFALIAIWDLPEAGGTRGATGSAGRVG
jgi:hypothetical protein